jgi:hypothetical protein
MPFLLIRGKFLPKRGQPDGDSVRFTPDDASLFDRLEEEAGRRLRTSTDQAGRVSVQLRYEGIDALEKDAKPDLPAQALANNKKLLGFVEDQNEEPPGYILASGIEKNGRPIVFVFAGSPSQEDGESVFLDTALLKKSVNYKQATAGLVYPIYYMSLYAELREALTKAIRKARAAGRGVWAEDKSNSGFAFKTGNNVRSLPPVFPKLYRRLQATKKTTPAAFLAELDAQGERVATLSDRRFVQFNDVIEAMSGNKLRLTYNPEDLVFQEG